MVKWKIVLVFSRGPLGCRFLEPMLSFAIPRCRPFLLMGKYQFGVGFQWFFRLENSLSVDHFFDFEFSFVSIFLLPGCVSSRINLRETSKPGFLRPYRWHLLLPNYWILQRWNVSIIRIEYPNWMFMPAEFAKDASVMSTIRAELSSSGPYFRP